MKKNRRTDEQVDRSFPIGFLKHKGWCDRWSGWDSQTDRRTDRETDGVVVMDLGVVGVVGCCCHSNTDQYCHPLACHISHSRTTEF